MIFFTIFSYGLDFSFMLFFFRNAALYALETVTVPAPKNVVPTVAVANASNRITRKSRWKLIYYLCQGISLSMRGNGSGTHFFILQNKYA